MQSYKLSTFLRYVLFADAATCTITGVLMTAGAGVLVGLTGLPSGLLIYAGIGLFLFAAMLIYLGTRREVSFAAIMTIVVVNALWTIDSLLLLVSGWVTPTTLGFAFVAFQAIGVAGFAVLEFVGLRKITGETSVSRT